MICEENASLLDNKPEVNTTGNKEVYESVYFYLYGYGLPIICACGFLGNVLNLIILAGKQAHRSLRKTEHAANTGLIALAVADMMFCISAFPSTFLPEDLKFSRRGFLLYYGKNCAAVISIFIMTSTWITVTMSTERYLAICHPLYSRKVLTLRRTKIAIVSVFFLSALFNLPMFWRWAITEKSCNGSTMYALGQEILFHSDTFDHAYRATWAVMGNFVPLILLLFFNVCLMREIHKSYAMRKHMNGSSSVHAQNDHEASNRVTITLIAIVVMFFILVAPSEILKHLAYLFGKNLGANYTYMTIEIITNVMQTINFSANFILYCIINPSFRKTMKEMFCFQYQKLKSEGYTDATMVGDQNMKERFSSLRMSTHTASSHGSSPRNTSMNTSVRSVVNAGASPSNHAP